jgi:hypothetical protein
MVLLTHIRAAFKESNESYGSSRMVHELREAGLIFDFTSFVALRVIPTVVRNIAPMIIGYYSTQLLQLPLCQEKEIAMIMPSRKASSKRLK